MLEIVMSVFGMCHLASSLNEVTYQQRCKYGEKVLTVEAEDPTPWQCIVYGQYSMAKWKEENPNWNITSWTCRPAGQIAKI